MELKGGVLTACRVRRGAPCGATWAAAPEALGLEPAEAARRFGLACQVHCQADPSAWDPISGKSSVHLAAELHEAALRRAAGRAALGAVG